MTTMLKGVSRKPSSFASTRTCPAISPAVRCRVSPIVPVRQKPHFMAQPTCVEMQNVCDGVSGMNTASIWRPSPNRSSSLVVPSEDVSFRTMSGVLMTATSASRARTPLGTSVMAEKSVTPFR